MLSKQFQAVDRDRWNDIKTALHNQAHIAIDADEGSDSTHGINFSWLYSGEVLTATIDVPKLGWLLKAAGFDSEQAVMDKFTGWIDSVH